MVALIRLRCDVLVALQLLGFFSRVSMRKVVEIHPLSGEIYTT
jgi:hypothetical protein